MTLRLRLILATTAVISILFGISEWLSHHQIAALLSQHEAILTESADHRAALEKLEAAHVRMLASTTNLRIMYAVGTFVIAVGILNYVWYRVVYRPIDRLLFQINIMGRGAWTVGLPALRNDEIGRLTTALNGLGEQLSSTFKHISTSSKLSALALVGNRLVREVTAVRSQISAARCCLECHTGPDVSAATVTLAGVERQLEGVEARFETEFDRELSSLSAVTNASQVVTKK